MSCVTRKKTANKKMAAGNSADEKEAHERFRAEKRTAHLFAHP